MKKIISFILIILMCGCTTEKEDVVYTCRQDAASATYSANFTFIIRSKDNKYISSIENSNTYTASFNDTNFDNIITALQKEEQKYRQEYTEAKIDFDIKKGQIFFRVFIPINNHNILIFKDADPNLIEDASLSINKYKEFLEKSNYICK